MVPPIAENLKTVRERINVACKRVGRNPASVTLVAVSKKKPAALIREAYAAGQHVFGENYAQELRDKAGELADIAIDWHFIGSLQRNKAKYVAPVVAMVETVDSLDAAQALSAKIPTNAASLPCLIEINVGEETSKSGISVDDIVPFAKQFAHIDRLALMGLMIIPPFQDDAEKNRPYFRELRALRDRLNGEVDLHHPLKELSMGMSHDFEIAIEEGATIVRVGTAIFGERNAIVQP
jgi:hypothetical protein